MAAVLLVDGDRNFGKALAIALRLDGLSVATADSVEAALARLADGAFRIVVVDCLLPGVDALFSRLSEAGVRVVATGTYPELVLGTARRYPGVIPIDKPFCAADLAAQLAELRAP